MDSIDFISKLLATSNGKDKVMRIVSYSSMLFASSKICPPGLKKSLVILSSELSSARTVLRLFDDLPMLNYSLSCLRNSNKSLEIYEQLSLWKVLGLGYGVLFCDHFRDNFGSLAPSWSNWPAGGLSCRVKITLTYVTEKLLVWDLSLQNYFGGAIFHWLWAKSRSHLSFWY